MLLQFTEIGLYAPTLSDLTQPEFDILSQRAQLIAESSLGANRPLALTTFTEKKQINRSLASLQLAYWPVVSVDTVRVRTGQMRTRSRRGVPAGQWYELTDPNSYQLDIDGRLNFYGGSSYYSTYYDNHYQGAAIADKATHWTMAEVTYQSGFDLMADPVPYELTQLKLALGLITTYLSESEGSASRVTQESVASQHSISYAVNTSSASGRAGLDQSFAIPEMYVLPFRKYMPRGGIT